MTSDEQRATRTCAECLDFIPLLEGEPEEDGFCLEISQDVSGRQGACEKFRSVEAWMQERPGV